MTTNECYALCCDINNFIVKIMIKRIEFRKRVISENKDKEDFAEFRIKEAEFINSQSIKNSIHDIASDILTLCASKDLKLDIYEEVINNLKESIYDCFGYIKIKMDQTMYNDYVSVLKLLKGRKELILRNALISCFYAIFEMP